MGLGSLLLGVHDENGKLRYAGNVGTGFDDRTLVELKSKIDAVAADASPFDGPTQHDRKAHWAKPVLLAEVSFGEWTGTGQIRHSVFRGLRTDKKPVAITRDRPKKVEDDMEATKTPSKSRSKSKSAAGSTDTAAAKPESASGRSPARKGSSAAAKSASAAPAGKAGLQVNVTNPERVIDPSTGLTKLDLVRYYGLVAPLLLEHLKGRPVSLVRAPSGIKGQLFFQKHLESKMPGVKSLDASLDPDHPPYLEVPTAAAVLSAAQMNVVEFHTWNAIKTAIDKPDRMTFDLDPGEGIDWKAMQQAASLMRGFLEQLGLESFLKTSGGKGLHVVVPLKKQHGWDTVKSFSQAIVQHVARTLPQLFVAKSGPSNRIGKIFVDYLRNGFGATTASAWSARARPGLGVSVPVRWDELDGLKSGSQWTVANIHERLDQGNAPWDGYAPQPIARAMTALDFKP
ncbi:3'-phosphoesterase / DNA ligase D / DNA repair polymerase (fragment) [Burkholderiales bacterium 8X]